MVLNIEMNMSRGCTDVSGIISKGRWRRYAEMPAVFIMSITFCASMLSMSAFSKATERNSPSFSIFTLSSLRRSPRSTATTLPLTGDVIFWASLRLSTNSGVPTSTVSFSLTITRGTYPMKSGGHTATVSKPLRASETVLTATPSIGMSKPLCNFIILFINRIYVVHSILCENSKSCPFSQK